MIWNNAIFFFTLVSKYCIVHIIWEETMNSFTKLTFLFVAGFCYNLGSVMAATAEYTLVRMKPGQGNRQFITPGDDSQGYCPDQGDNCYVIVSVDGPDGPCDEVLPGGLILTGKVSGVTGYHVNGVDSQAIPKSGFTFAPGEYAVRITACSAYPSYVNMQVSLDGIVVEPDGTFRVLFPYIP